jgi:UDP-N-acetylmuramate dehydrogenase
LSHIQNKADDSVKLDIKNVKYRVSMNEHTSFRVGGEADIFIEPDSIDELIKALKLLRRENIPYHLMGNGSNLLVSDSGIRGAVIKLAEKFNNIEIKGEQVAVQSGVLLSTLSKLTARNGLTGLEFASGIPGTLGGAIAMNAGAYGGEMKDVVEWVELLSPDFELIRLNNNEMQFGYRSSIVQQEGYIVIGCGIKLKYGKQQEINETMSELATKRKTKQPLHLPSAGSTFKRPEGYFAGKLIEDAGLKGFQIGGAQVSPMHCGFVVNTADATADDVHKLIKYVQDVVYTKFGVKLDTEVKMLGEF